MYAYAYICPGEIFICDSRSAIFWKETVLLALAFSIMIVVALKLSFWISPCIVWIVWIVVSLL